VPFVVLYGTHAAKTICTGLFDLSIRVRHIRQSSLHALSGERRSPIHAEIYPHATLTRFSLRTDVVYRSVAAVVHKQLLGATGES